MQTLRVKSILIVFAILLIIGLLPLQAQEEGMADGSERPLLMAHFMPWYQSPEVTGYWGWHWTMDHFDPSQVDENGRPQMAAHHTPLTGPYDSSDPDILEYQVLLMKLSGIDGVIVDWYGTSDHADYGLNNRATVALFDYIERAGLRFIIMYEDRTLRQMVSDGAITENEALPQAQADIQFLQDNWFTMDAYVKYNDQPLLFFYGPQYFRNPDSWEEIFTVADPVPRMVTLDGHMDWAALSAYPWPPMDIAGGITLPRAVVDSYLNLFYRNARRRDYVVGSAFPGFHDIYSEAGVRSPYGIIEPEDGDTLRHTIDLALQANSEIIQLVTWNDYGEGTIIEPTEEFGYDYLEIVQDTRRELGDPDFAFTPEDLELPLQLFNLRKANKGNEEVNARLDEVFDAILAGDTETARAILAEFAESRTI